MNGGAPEQRLLKSVHDSLTYWQRQQESPSPRVARQVTAIEREMQRGHDHVVDREPIPPGGDPYSRFYCGHPSRPKQETAKPHLDALTRAEKLLDFVTRAASGDRPLDWYHVEKLTAAMQIILEQMRP